MDLGATVFAPAGPRITPSESAFFAQANPFGFILFARNYETPDQLRRLTGDLRQSVGWDAPIFIDQEGGRVARLTAPHFTEFLPPLDDVAQLGNHAQAGLALRYKIIAAELRAVGIDGNCSPLGDIARPDTHPVLRNRCYGTSPDAVIGLARAVGAALLDGGVLPVVKHIPGHGRAVLDSHLELPTVDAPFEDLKPTDFKVFKGLNHLPIGMTAHLRYTAIDDRPATFSKKVINMIRSEIGFGGLLMTDDISMEALDGTVHQRGASALEAGCDIVLHCNGKLKEMVKLAELGPMTNDAHARAQKALSMRSQAKKVDIPALSEEFAALYRGSG